MTDLSLVDIAENSEIEILNISCLNITGTSICRITECCNGLQSLTFYDFRSLKDRSMEMVSQHCPHLKTLKSLWCKDLTNLEMEMIAHECPELKSTELSSCSNDLCVLQLPQYVRGCKNISMMDHIPMHLYNMMRRKLRHSVLLDDDKEAKDLLKNLQSLEVNRSGLTTVQY